MERELLVPLVRSQWALQLQRSARFFVPGAPYTLVVSKSVRDCAERCRCPRVRGALLHSCARPCACAVLTRCVLWCSRRAGCCRLGEAQPRGSP